MENISQGIRFLGIALIAGFITHGAFAQNVVTSEQNNSSSFNILERTKITYLGLGYGPGIDFSGARQSNTNGNDPFFISHRPRVMFKATDRFALGLEARVATIFNPEGVRAQNQDYRLLATFSNLYKTNELRLTYSQRILLPTSNASRNVNMLPGLISLISLDYTPTQSRFSGTAGIEVQRRFYEESTAKNTAGVKFWIVDPFLEANYQVTPSLQLTASYWPDYFTNDRLASPLHNGSNEVDVGVNFDITKSWTITPTIATEMNGIKAANLTQQMQLNLAVTGTFL